MIFKEGQEGDTVNYVGSIARANSTGDPHLADDLTQEVLLVALANAPRDMNRLLPWLRAIVLNKLKFARFKSASQPRLSTNADDDLECMRGRELDPIEALSQAELKERVQKLLLALPSRHQEVVRMRALEGLPPREVAERLDMSVETVRTIYRRSLAVLREGAEREFGAHAPGGLRSPAVLFWGLPKRAVWSAFALTSAFIVGAVGLWKLQVEPDFPESLAPIDAQVDLAAGIASGDLMTLPAETRVPAGRLRAQVDLRVFDEGQAAVGEEIALMSDAGSVVLGRTDEGGALQLRDLAPGPWAALHRGKVIGSKEIESGANLWDLQVDLKLGMQVTVVDLDGGPRPGIEVHRYDDLTGRSSLLGQTDAAGRFEGQVPCAGSWVAARGPVGRSSRATYLNQPIIEGQGGELQLVLEDNPVSWHQIRFPDEVPLNSRDVVVRHGKPNSTTQQLINSGTHQSSLWLPPWRRADGAYGVRRGWGHVFAALDEAGHPWWISQENRKADPLDSILNVDLPFAVTGQLVNSLGLPVVGMEVFVTGGAVEGITNLRTTTDVDGRFRLAGCSGDGVNLQCELGRQVRAMRPVEGNLVDLGVWDVRPMTVVGLEALGSPGPWKCTTFKPNVRAALPKLTPSLLGVASEFRASSAFEHCRVEINRRTTGGAILVEAGAGESTRRTFVKRPREGWPTEPIRVDLGSARTVRLYAQIPKDRLPVRAIWVEDDLGWTSTALADPATGIISSAQLPAGRWSLKLVDRLGLLTTSDVAAVGAGKEYDFGALAIQSGRARISIPMGALGLQSPGGLLRVAGQDNTVARVPIKAGGPIPLEMTVELPAGKCRFFLRMNGRYSAVGEATIERGFITDVTLSREHFFVEFASTEVQRPLLTDMSIKLVNSEGGEVWRASMPAPDSRTASRPWFIVPRIPNTELHAEHSDGTLVPNLLDGLEVVTHVSLPFERWSGSKE